MPRDLPLSNGSLLVNFDHTYQIRDLYWPHVGQYNHTNGQSCRFGIWVNGLFFWLDDSGWQRTLAYQEDSLVTDVKLSHPRLPVSLKCRDAVDFHENVYLKEVSVESLDGQEHEVRLFFGHDLSISGNSVGDSAYYEPERRCLFHYKGRQWFLLNGAKQVDDEWQFGVDQWAVGIKGVGDKEGAWRDAEDGELSGNPVAQGSVDSVMALHLRVPSHGKATGYVWIAVGEDFSQVARINRLLRNKKPALFLERTRSYWVLWANKDEHQFPCISKQLCYLYRRSLLILRTQIDNQGAILAANDFDIARFNSDTYSYMWPRDGALVASALIQSRYSEISRRFFDFCHTAITSEGYLLHKYNPDGSLASSWHAWTLNGTKELPIQEDETALVVWALWKHFQEFRDIEFIKPHYRGLVTRAANWMTWYRCQESGLPLSSWDLWEERHGVHGWTVGAVWGGLMAAANFTEAFGEEEVAEYYREIAASIKEATERYLWMENENRFARMVTKQEDGDWQQDSTMDASLMGLWYFGMYKADDPKIIATMEAMRQRLWVKTEVGGMARYENDYYHQISQDIEAVPGNPWFICTLWLGQWYIAKAKSKEDLEPAMEIIQWCADRTLESGVMAEQVNPYTNEPLSVSPLTWSHATLVMAINEYMTKMDEFGW